MKQNKKIPLPEFEQFWKSIKSKCSDDVYDAVTKIHVNWFTNDDKTKPKYLTFVQNILQPNTKEKTLKIFPELEKASWVKSTNTSTFNKSIHIIKANEYASFSNYSLDTSNNGFIIDINYKLTNSQISLSEHFSNSYDENLLNKDTNYAYDFAIDLFRKRFYESLFNSQNEKQETSRPELHYGINLYTNPKIRVENKTIDWNNIDQLKNGIIEKKPDGVLSDYLILMHVDTFSKLAQISLSKNAQPLYDKKSNNINEYFYKNIKIIASSYYPYKPKITGEFNHNDKPALIINLNDAVVSNTSIALYDEQTTESTILRVIETTGEFKLKNFNESSMFLEID